MNEIVTTSRNSMTPEFFIGLDIEQKYSCDKPECFFCLLLKPKRERPKLAAKERVHAKWSNGQEKYLIHNWNLLNLHQMALFLNKSKSTIQLKAKQLGLGNKTPIHDQSAETGPRGALNDNFNGWF